MTACGTRFILGLPRSTRLLIINNQCYHDCLWYLVYTWVAEVYEVINNKQPMLPMTACGTRFILSLPRSTRLLTINNQCYL